MATRIVLSELAADAKRRPASTRAGDFIRNNVLAVVALFVALGGTAYATHPGGENTVSSGDIINGHVRTPDLRDQEVTAAKLAPNSVSTNKVVDGSLTGADISTNRGGTLTDRNLALWAVGEPELAPDAVSSTKVQDGAIGAAQLADGAVGPPQLAADAITDNNVLLDFGSTKVAENAIAASEIADGAVRSAEVLDQSLFGQDIGNNAISSDEVQDNSLDGNDVDESSLAPSTDVESNAFTGPSFRAIPDEGTLTAATDGVGRAGNYLVIGTADTINTSFDDGGFVGCFLTRQPAAGGSQIIYGGDHTGRDSTWLEPGQDARWPMVATSAAESGDHFAVRCSETEGDPGDTFVVDEASIAIVFVDRVG